MQIKFILLPFLYKKIYVEISENGSVFTKVVSEDEAEEIKRDLEIN